MRRDSPLVSSSSSSSPESSGVELELESFQRHVADLFRHMCPGSVEENEEQLLSLTWILKLLETFLVCQEEFCLILSNKNNRSVLSRPPLDRILTDYFDRTVKALDLCNAIRGGIDRLRNWGKHLDILASALNTSSSDQRKTTMIGEGQFRRAKRALADLTIVMLDDRRDSGSSGTTLVAQRNRSFGRNNNNLGSLSWRSVSNNWSAARQLQAIASNLTPPRNNEIAATNGLAVPIFTMNSVLLFVMWTLVAAIPCQDRGGLQVHLSIPRGFLWASPVSTLHERILEESKKRDRKNSIGLLKEIHQTEKCTGHLCQLVLVEDDSATQFPLSDEKVLLEVSEEMQELLQVSDAMKKGLDPFERQVRKVFHRIIRTRTEGLDYLARQRQPQPQPGHSHA